MNPCHQIWTHLLRLLERHMVVVEWARESSTHTNRIWHSTTWQIHYLRWLSEPWRRPWLRALTCKYSETRVCGVVTRKVAFEYYLSVISGRNTSEQVFMCMHTDMLLVSICVCIRVCVFVCVCWRTCGLYLGVWVCVRPSVSLSVGRTSWTPQWNVDSEG